MVEPLADLFSERALILERLRVEIRWLQALASLSASSVAIDPAAAEKLGEISANLSEQDALAVKELEKSTNHDVKAVEIHLGEICKAAGLEELIPWIHFGCTSWDINNLAYANLMQQAQREILVPALEQIRSLLAEQAASWADAPMLGRTHSQPASPTTMGKEFRVYERRLAKQLGKLESHVFDGKFNGAVGNYNALQAACPDVDWPATCKSFVEAEGLRFAHVTTQIEPYDGTVEFFDAISRINRIFTDLAQDASFYIGYGYLKQKTVATEAGSSTMPHKINPIQFENAEGNIAIANALLHALCDSLQVSRMQRDLSGSTVVRNIGVAFGHSFLAWRSLEKGLRSLSLDKEAMLHDLQGNWQVLAEAVQSVLRTLGDSQAYDKLKEHTRGQKTMTEADYRQLVEQLVPKGPQQDALLKLRPESYLGLAIKLAQADDETSTSRRKT